MGMRQRDDERFLGILNRFRVGSFANRDIKTLVDPARSADRPEALDTTFKNATRLFPTIREVSAYNKQHYRELEGNGSASYHAVDSSRIDTSIYPHLKHLSREIEPGILTAMEGSRVAKMVDLAVGMPVILLRNLSDDLVNGSQRIVKAFEEFDMTKWIEDIDTPYTGLTGGTDIFGLNLIMEMRSFFARVSQPQIVPIVKFDGVMKTIYPRVITTTFISEAIKLHAKAFRRMQSQAFSMREILVRLQPPMLWRTQVPLAPRWAMSVHKSQGMTLKQVVVDLSRAFAEGQVYVALSKAESLDGLRVEGREGGTVKCRGIIGRSL